jgi:hypothetical protein
LHRFDAQNPKIGLPAMELEERVVIKAQSYGQALPVDGAIEHAAERDSVYRHGLDSKANDSATELIHDDQDPVRPKQDRIGPEQVQTPQAILGMTEHRQPRRPTPAPVWVVVPGQNAANHVLIYSPTVWLKKELTYKSCALRVAARLHVSAKAIPYIFFVVFIRSYFGRNPLCSAVCSSAEPLISSGPRTSLKVSQICQACDFASANS